MALFLWKFYEDGGVESLISNPALKAALATYITNRLLHSDRSIILVAKEQVRQIICGFRRTKRD